MSDGHDPIEGRIDDGFDRLRSDAQALDAMAPLRSLRERQGSLPGARIALGGGLVAAVLVLVGVFAFGGDDEPEEIVAGPGREELDLLFDLIGEWALLGGVTVDGDIVVEPDDWPEDMVDVLFSATPRNGVTIDGGVRLAIDGFERRTQSRGNVDEAISRLFLTYGGCLDYAGTLIHDPEVGQVFGPFEQLRARCEVDDTGDLPERLFDALATVNAVSIDEDGLLILEAEQTSLFFGRVGEFEGRPLTDTVTDLDDQPALPIPLTNTVTDLDDRVAGQLPPGLDNTRWVLIDGGSEVPLLEQWRPMRLWFDDGRFVVAGYCTGINGEPGGPRVFDNASTDQADFSLTCPAEVVDIDAVFLTAMRTVTDGRLEGRNLVLTAAAGDLVFAPEQVIDIDAFTGVRWELEAWDLSLDGTGKEPLTPAWLEMRPAVNPEADQPSGTVRGTTGCLEFSGRWILADNTIAFVEEFDLDSCGEELILTDQDEQVYYSVGTNVVPLFRADGTVALISTREVEGSLFRRGAAIDMSDAPLEGTTWRLIAMGLMTLRGETFTMEFDGDRYTGQTSCGVVDGTFTLDGELFDASHDSDDIDLCSSDGFATEDFVRRLANADRLVRQNGQLIISTGESSLVFEPNDN